MFENRIESRLKSPTKDSSFGLKAVVGRPIFISSKKIPFYVTFHVNFQLVQPHCDLRLFQYKIQSIRVTEFAEA